MKRLLCVLHHCKSLLSFLLVVTTVSHARIVTDSIQSKVLNTTVRVNVYLPTSYDVTNHYPVLYLLHGLTDTYEAWERKGQMHIVADELLQAGEIRPFVIIMPNAGGPDTRNTWNGYFDMPDWPYHQFFYEELLPTFEQRYNAGGDKGHRALSGLSMGGGGSCVYAQRHPDMFSSCYIMSGWLDSDDATPDPTNKRTCVSHAVHDNACVPFLHNATDEQKAQLRTLRWFIDVGDDDYLLFQSTEFYRLMRDNHIPCEFRVRNGGHSWEYWHTALRTSLPFASRNFQP